MECSRPVRLTWLAIFAITLSLAAICLLWPSRASAGGSDPGRPKPEPNEPKTNATVKVVSRPDGVYVEISVHETSSASHKV